MKYQIVAVTIGHEALIAETDDKNRAKQIYTNSFNNDSFVRMKVNGRMLRIFEADDKYLLSNRYCIKGGKSRGKRTCKGNT